MQSKKRTKPDPKYQDLIVAKFVNYVMHNGKKSVAQTIVHGAIAELDKKSNGKGLELFHKALENVGPMLEVRSKRIGGANYQVPIEVTRERKIALAMRWMIDAARSQKGVSMITRLSKELDSASKGEGLAIKKKEDTHRMAEANRAFAHFAKM
ncbi:MAG: 30S ribosomal protein S7 [bacterium]